MCRYYKKVLRLGAYGPVCRMFAPRTISVGVFYNIGKYQLYTPKYYPISSFFHQDTSTSFKPLCDFPPPFLAKLHVSLGYA